MNSFATYETPCIGCLHSNWTAAFPDFKQIDPDLQSKLDDIYIYVCQQKSAKHNPARYESVHSYLWWIDYLQIYKQLICRLEYTMFIYW